MRVVARMWIAGGAVAVTAAVTVAVAASGGCVSGGPANDPLLEDPVVDVAGGTLDELRFAIVGDTRPINEDDTANYPTAVITKIWDDVEAEVPHPRFAVSTGDYMNASPGGREQGAQLDAYLGARAHYTGPAYATMGNHECTGSTVSNCGHGAADGVTPNFAAFLDRMVVPLGANRPWYTVHLDAADHAWTAKIVVIAANAWSDEQAAWLDGALAAPTTYTIVVRHEPSIATAVNGVVASNAILARHAVTLLLVGHVHTYAHDAGSHEVLIGNGGAPLTSSIDYGYAIAFRRPDGAIDLTVRDYLSAAAIDHFAVAADGSPAP